MIEIMKVSVNKEELLERLRFQPKESILHACTVIQLNGAQRDEVMEVWDKREKILLKFQRGSA